MPITDPDDLSIEFARAVDAASPLREHRERFVFADDTIYLDGNSLGRLPRRTSQRLREVIDLEWGRDLIRSWPTWIARHDDVAAALATGVLSVRPTEVTIADSTTVNLYKVINAAADLRPDRSVILIERDNFPTDLYVVEGIAKARGMSVRVVESDIDGGLSTEQVREVLDDDVALACFCHVSYRSGAIADIEQITGVLHDAGAVAVWDLCHSAGAIRTPLAQARAEFAVGCTYKYLNSGPGAPAFLYVREDLVPQVRQPIWGWFGQRDQFAMDGAYDPVDGIARFTSGTPAVLGLSAIEEGVRTITDAGIDELEQGGRLLTGYGLVLADSWLAPLGFSVASPRAASRRGSHLTLHHREAWQICQAMIARGVVPDFRTPDRLRLGMAPLTTSFEDVWRGFDAIRDIVETGAHQQFPAERSRVT